MMKTQGFEARFSQNLAPVSREKPQNPYLAYISPLFSKPYIVFWLANLSAASWVHLNFVEISILGLVE